MALALYRKYRPRTFAEVIGQEHVTEPLSQALRSGRLHHAYLFSGPRGCGKTSSARILARSLNCEQGPTPEPCGVCASCKSLANDGAGSIDVIEIDAASHGGVDDARDLREKAFFAPASSRYKIYVIDEAHMVSSAGFNALLKLVEEPPEYVKFIFATTEPEKVLGTIRSRTHHYPFRLIPPATLRPYLAQLTDAEGVRVDPAVFPLVVRAGGGSARDTLSVLDQLIAGAGPDGVSYARAVTLLGVTDVALIDEMCDALAAGDGAAAYQTIDRVAEAGHDARRFASDLLERFRDLIVLQQVPDAVTKGLIDGPADQLEQMSAQATRLGPATLSRCADIVHNGLVEMRGTTAPRLLLELITARMLLPGADDSSGALLQRLERMERRLTLGADEVRPQQDSPVAAAPAPGGGGGISAARAAAAAASRRAPAPSGSVSAAPGSPPTGHAEPESATQVPAAPVPAAPVSAAPVSISEAASADPAAPDLAIADGAVVDPRADLGNSTAAPSTWQDAPHVAPSSAGAVSPPADLAPAGREHRAPAARRPEPAAVMPDAPEEPGAVLDAGVPGQLSAASIREVWPEIMVAVGRKSKKIAALAQGATVRDLEGQTVVLTFRFPAHAKMVAAEPSLISDALYEALGGRWQIRCDVAGESGPSQGSSAPGPAPRGPQGQAGGGPSPSAPGPAQRGPATSRPDDASDRGVQAQSAGSTATRLREPAPRASVEASEDDGDGWPEPARPGGLATAAGVQASALADDDADGWPEPARPGGMPPSSVSAGRPGTASTDPAGGDPRNGHGHEGSHDGGPDARAQAGGQGISGGQSSNSPAGAQGVNSPAGAQGANSPTGAQGFESPAGAQSLDGGGAGTSFNSARAGQGAGGAGNGQGSGDEVAARASAAQAIGAQANANGSGGSAGGLPTNRGPASSGLAAARAAAAGAGKGVAATKNAASAAKGGAGSKNSAWADGSPTEEAPYDPEYDGPARPGAAYEGFDPGDEPLDDVIDEKTARQSSEQQAVQLLRDALGAEKISES